MAGTPSCTASASTRCGPPPATASSACCAGRRRPTAPPWPSTPTSITSMTPRSSPSASGSRGLAGAMWPPALRDELERSAGWPRVRYLGRVDHGRVAEVLARAKVGIIPLHPHPAYRDALPVKLFEYLAAGLAVISIDVPRWREVL